MAGKDLAKTIDFFGFMQGLVGFMGMGNNHGIHHRGQLAAYLRAMGSKVPTIYGGSADEPMAGM
ncbi:MAG: DinB family protein [Gemmatimonadales bacterium]